MILTERELQYCRHDALVGDPPEIPVVIIPGGAPPTACVGRSRSVASRGRRYWVTEYWIVVGVERIQFARDQCRHSGYKEDL